MATGDAVRTVVNALRPLRIDGEENRRVTPWWAPVIDLFWWLVLSFVANALLSALGAQAEDAWVALPVFAAGMTLISRFGRISMGTAARHRKAAAVVGVIALALVVYGQTVLIEPPAHRYSGPVRAATAVLGSLIAVYAFATVTHLPDWRCSYRNLVRAGQAACSYSWRMPPRRSRLRMSRRINLFGSAIGGGSGFRGLAFAMPWCGRCSL